MPRANPGTVPAGRLGLGLFRSFRLNRRKIASESESDSGSGAVAALAGSGVVLEVMSVYVIEGTQLDSHATIEPIIDATATDVSVKETAEMSGIVNRS